MNKKLLCAAALAALLAAMPAFAEDASADSTGVKNLADGFCAQATTEKGMTESFFNFNYMLRAMQMDVAFAETGATIEKEIDKAKRELLEEGWRMDKCNVLKAEPIECRKAHALMAGPEAEPKPEEVARFEALDEAWGIKACGQATFHFIDESEDCTTDEATGKADCKTVADRITEFTFIAGKTDKGWQIIAPAPTPGPENLYRARFLACKANLKNFTLAMESEYIFSGSYDSVKDEDGLCQYLALDEGGENAPCLERMKESLQNSCRGETLKISFPESWQYEITVNAFGPKSCCLCASEYGMLPENYEDCEAGGECKCGH